MSIKNNIVRKQGVSLISREAAISRKEFFMKNKIYWEQFEKKIGLHKIVKNALLNLQEPTAEFLVVPRPLEKFFLLYLNKFFPSQQNKQCALNVARVFALLSHQYYHSAEKFNMKVSFFVSPSIWEKWLIGRKAKKTSIKILEEMGLITKYRFNRNKNAPAEESRFVIMYQFNLQKVKWLYACVKTLIALEQKTSCEDQRVVNKYEEITEDIFGYIEKVEDEEKYLF